MQINYRTLLQRILRFGFITAMIACMIYLAYAYSASFRVGSGQRELSKDTEYGKATLISGSLTSKVAIRVLPGPDSELRRNAINLMFYQGSSRFSEFHALVLNGLKNSEGQYILTGGKLVNEGGDTLFDITEQFLTSFDVQFAYIASELSAEGEKNLEQAQQKAK